MGHRCPGPGAFTYFLTWNTTDVICPSKAEVQKNFPGGPFAITFDISGVVHLSEPGFNYGLIIKQELQPSYHIEKILIVDPHKLLYGHQMVRGPRFGNR